MRRLALALALLLAPLATGANPTDTRELVANHVMRTECPGVTFPATIACLHAPQNSTSLRVVATPDVGDAEPRFYVRVYNGSRLMHSFFHCSDLTTSAIGATHVYVELSDDRTLCPPPRAGLILHGTLTAIWS